MMKKHVIFLPFYFTDVSPTSYRVETYNYMNKYKDTCRSDTFTYECI